ncbi:unnamed protein product, partial [Mesorhabditis belari]|uniref:Uncharacterized protein n=1 Tax=Mesorhabditis belari TaxID=2138241 RepID=A0AAF3J1W6_9BILA
MSRFFALVVALDPDALRAYASPLQSENNHNGRPVLVHCDEITPLKVGSLIRLKSSTYDTQSSTYITFEKTEKCLPTDFFDDNEIVAFESLVVFNEKFADKDALDGLIGWNLQVGRVMVSNSSLTDRRGGRLLPGIVYQGLIYCPARNSIKKERQLMHQHESMWLVQDLVRSVPELRGSLQKLFTQEIPVASQEKPATVWSFLPPSSLNISIYDKPMRAPPPVKQPSPIVLNFQSQGAQTIMDDVTNPFRSPPPISWSQMDDEQKQLSPSIMTPPRPLRKIKLGFGESRGWLRTNKAITSESIWKTQSRDNASVSTANLASPEIAYIVRVVHGKYAIAYSFQRNLIWYDLTKISKITQLSHEPTVAVTFTKMVDFSCCPGAANNEESVNLQAVDVSVEEDAPNIKFQLCTPRTESFTVDDPPKKDTIKCRLRFTLFRNSLRNEFLEKQQKDCYFPSHVIRELTQLYQYTELKSFEIFIRVRPECAPDEKMAFEYHCMYDETSGTRGSMEIRSYVARRGKFLRLMDEKRKK